MSANDRLFGRALEQLRAAYKVRRESWPVGVYLELDLFGVPLLIAVTTPPEGAVVIVSQPHVLTWADAFADDWQLVTDPSYSDEVPTVV